VLKSIKFDAFIKTVDAVGLKFINDGRELGLSNLVYVLQLV
jgi:hypothetical protein